MIHRNSSSHLPFMEDWIVKVGLDDLIAQE